jgi:hypothetical protein
VRGCHGAWWCAEKRLNMFLAYQTDTHLIYFERKFLWSHLTPKTGVRRMEEAASCWHIRNQCFRNMYCLCWLGCRASSWNKAVRLDLLQNMLTILSIIPTAQLVPFMSSIFMLAHERKAMSETNVQFKTQKSV